MQSLLPVRTHSMSSMDFQNTMYAKLFDKDPVIRCKTQTFLALLTITIRECQLLFSDTEIQDKIKACALEFKGNFSPFVYRSMIIKQPVMTLARRYTANQTHGLSMQIIAKLLSVETNQSRAQIMIYGISKVPSSFLEIADPSPESQNQRNCMHMVFDLLDYIRGDPEIAQFFVNAPDDQHFNLPTPEENTAMFTLVQNRALKFYDRINRPQSTHERAMGLALLHKLRKFIDVSPPDVMNTRPQVANPDAQTSLAQLIERELAIQPSDDDELFDSSEVDRIQEHSMHQWCYQVFRQFFPRDPTQRLQVRLDLQLMNEANLATKPLFTEKSIKQELASVFARHVNLEADDLAMSSDDAFAGVSLRQRYEGNRKHKPSYDVLLKLAEVSDNEEIKQLVRQGLKTVSAEFWSHADPPQSSVQQREQIERMCDLIDYIRADDSVLRQMKQVDENNSMQFNNNQKRAEFLQTVLHRATQFISAQNARMTQQQRYANYNRLHQKEQMVDREPAFVFEPEPESNEISGLPQAVPPWGRFQPIDPALLMPRETSIVESPVAESDDDAPPIVQAPDVGNALDYSMIDAYRIDSSKPRPRKQRKWIASRLMQAVDDVLRKQPKEIYNTSMYHLIAIRYKELTPVDEPSPHYLDVKQMMRRNDMQSTLDKINAYIALLKLSHRGATR